MVQSKAKTVAAYLKELSSENKKNIKDVRKVVLDNIDPAFDETMNWGMITYEVPLSLYPETYNKKPLMFVSLAAQKNNCSLYLMCIYQHKELNKQLLKGFDEIGKKPNMGKSCIRFKKCDDIPLSTIGKIIKKISIKKYIKLYEEARNSNNNNIC